MTKINDIITDEDPVLYAETAVWCNENNAYIEEIEPEGDVRRFQVKAIPEPTIEEKNEAIRQQRQARFAAESDPLKFDYDEAVARSNGEASSDVVRKKFAWLEKKDQIREELPYMEAEDGTV